MAKKIVYSDPWLTIEKKRVRVRGKAFDYRVHRENDVAVVVPVLEDGRILIERQFRHAIGKWLLELPAGAIDDGEKPEQGARRELEEETGYRAGRMELMCKQYGSPSSGPKVFYYYCASRLKKTGRTKFDGTETIRTLPLSADRIEKMLRSGAILDHKLVEGYLYYKAFMINEVMQ
ncbi:MAG: NUDIX hydrolase [Candidatus Micrarchaeota archaeon]|nr:NUDIX hydrolase [Candidatus Micrarchaeota archaeon]MDE1864263.1 NUDIX hydrolase [Candidatus Micrarchaeota archaeon]